MLEADQSIEKISELTESSKITSFGFWFLQIIFLLSFAQVIKLAVNYFTLPIFLNEKFAFSLPVPSTVTFVIYIIVLLVLLSVLISQGSKLDFLTRSGFILIFSGGLSNFVERIFSGYVVDYVFFLNGVFNLADIYIIVGVILLLTTYRRQT